MGWYWILAIIYVGCMISAFLTARIAASKFYHVTPWFIIGFFIPVVGLIAMAGMSPNAADDEIKKDNKTSTDRLQLVALILTVFAAFGLISAFTHDMEARSHKATLTTIQLRHELGQISESDCSRLVMAELRRYEDPDTTFFLEHGHHHIYVRSK